MPRVAAFLRAINVGGQTVERCTVSSLPGYEIRDSRFEIRGLVRLVALFLLGMAPAMASAQMPTGMAPIDSGRVVRAWVGDVAVRGRLLAPLDPAADSVRYCRYPGPPCGSAPVPAQVAWLSPGTVTHLEVATGTRAVRGAWIGGITQMLMTMAAVSLADGFDECRSCNRSTTEYLFAGLVGGAIGAGIGALIGSGFDRMERVY